MFFTLYAYSFRMVWAEPVYLSPDAATRADFALWMSVLLSAGGAVILLLLGTWRRRERASLWEAASLLALALIGLVVLLGMWSWLGTEGPNGLALPAQAAHVGWLTGFFNLVLFAAAIGVLMLGWVRNQPGLANLGIFVFFVQVVTRYFDLLGGMLSSGLLFIGAGLLLILGGLFLERSRRRLLAAMSTRASP